MRRRKTRAILVLCLVFAACTPEVADRSEPEASVPPQGGRIELGVLGEPATLDPYGDDASDLTYALVRPVFPTPYRITPDGSVVPELALALEPTGEGARLTLQERRWSDGRPVSARDVVASIRRATFPSGFAEVDDARVVRPRVIEMTGKIDDWERTLATGAFVLPRGRLSGGNVSAGPFSFAAYEEGRRVAYHANEQWPEAPLLDGIEVSFVQGTELMIRLLEDGAIDAAWLPSSVNLGDRLDELGIAYSAEIGSEKLVLKFDPDRISRGAAMALIARLDLDDLDETFLRTDGQVRSFPAQRGGRPPASTSMAVPEGDELLSLIQRAMRLDLARADIALELLSGPVSVVYGRWQVEPPAGLLLQRSSAPKFAPRSVAIASVATYLAWREEVHGMAVNPSLEGPLWNAREWWIEPSI